MKTSKPDDGIPDAILLVCDQIERTSDKGIQAILYGCIRELAELGLKRLDTASEHEPYRNRRLYRVK